MTENQHHPGLRVCDVSRNAFGILKLPNPVARLATHGITVTQRPASARIIVAENRRALLRAMLKGALHQRCFLYTDEPGYDQTLAPRSWLIPGLRRVEVMNVFTGDVFVDASAFIANFVLNKPAPAFDVEDLRRRFARKRGAAFITYRPEASTRRVVGGRDVDLNARRIQLAMAGHERGVVDIFGSGFPEGVARGSTGWGFTGHGEQWWDVKHRTLSAEFTFNLCLENTDWPFYITEKLWQSVRAGCLPIYHGRNNRIGDVLPKNSFIEAADFPDPAELYRYIEHLSFEEFLARLDRCRAGYVALQAAYQAGETDSENRRVDRLAARLKAAASR